MSVEVRPLGDKCNIGCTYCYQEGTRASSTAGNRYEISKIIEVLNELDEPFTLFGGEIMLTKRRDLEHLLEFGQRRYGQVGLQTNGTLVKERDIDLFLEHNVKVGVSIDGPGELNDARWAGSLRATRRATAMTEAVIETMCRTGAPPGVIVTLHRLNAVGERLAHLCGWLQFLDTLGVTRVRLHLLENDNAGPAEDLVLTTEQALLAMRRLRALERMLVCMRFDLFRELESMLLGQDDEASCVFRACDPYLTRAVIGVEGDGRRSNCGRTNKDGIAYTPATVNGYERQLGLYAMPQEEGGCKGCRFFLMCKGNCPGTAIDGDWRLRSVDCLVWFGLFEDTEARLLSEGRAVLSQSPQRTAVEAIIVEGWRDGHDRLLREACDLVGGL